MRLAPAVLLVATLGGCQSKELLDAKAELATTKARLAALEKRRHDLQEKQQTQRASRETLAQQADEAELARVRLTAALTALDEGKVPDSLLLDEAMRTKDPKLDALAAQVVQRQLPCVEEKDAEASAEEHAYDDCAPPPPEDACEGVEERVRQSFKWDCGLSARTGFPTAAVCTADAEWESDVVPDLASATRRVAGQVVRIAFEKDGRLFVRDWPPPSVDLYEPPNAIELKACAATNEVETCTRRCDESFGRLGCGDDGYEGEYEEGEVVVEENPDLAAAREAAAQAEAEAQRAREELEYQQCLDTCRPGDEDDARPKLELIRFTLASSPAPGVFVLRARHLLEDSEEPADETRTLVLHHSDFVALAQGTLAPGEDTVKPLTELLDVVDLEVASEEASVLIAGLDRNQLVAVRAALDGNQPPAAVDAEEACRVLERKPKSGKALLEACRRGPAPKADAGAPPAARPADGGAP